MILYSKDIYFEGGDRISQFYTGKSPPPRSGVFSGLKGVAVRFWDFVPLFSYGEKNPAASPPQAENFLEYVN